MTTVMSRGANKENIASRFIAQGAFSNIGALLPGGDLSMKSKSVSPHEAKLQNFLKKVVIGQKVPLKPAPMNFQTKNSSSRGSPRSSTNTTGHTEHTQRDRYTQHLNASSERLNAMADSAYVQVNKEKVCSVTPQPRGHSKGQEGRERSPDGFRNTNAISRSTANMSQKSRPPHISGELYYEEMQKSYTESHQPDQAKIQKAKSSIQRLNTQGSSTKQYQKGQTHQNIQMRQIRKPDRR